MYYCLLTWPSMVVPEMWGVMALLGM
jgi:hypothetical protein